MGGVHLLFILGQSWKVDHKFVATFVILRLGEKLMGKSAFLSSLFCHWSLSISNSFDHHITKFFNASSTHASSFKLVQKAKANATSPFTFTKTSPES